MAVLCQLADPDNYRPFDWSLHKNPQDFAYWTKLFADFPINIEQRLREEPLNGNHFESRWSEFCREYDAGMATFRAQATASDEITTIRLCNFRQSLLNKYGWYDPYRGIKQRENEMACSLYPHVVDRVDATPVDARWEWLLRCLYAGNMFDLGAPKTIEMFNRGQIDFFAMLEQIPDRPWFIDDVDEVRCRIASNAQWKQVLFFVDNAGSDIVLGVVPLVREMARAGIRIVLAANSRPALNDITHEELEPLLQRLGNGDSVLAELMATDRIATVPSGGDIPLIDLSHVSNECNTAAQQSDLIVLEGMGRGVESNWRQTFKCDAWRMALIKDESVARWVGCNVFDPICRFDARTP